MGRVTDHRMPADQARQVLEELTVGRVGVVLGGGWCVDALLGEQTREHSDLDLWVPADQLHELLGVVAALGVDRVLPWPGDRPWNWVLHDGGSRRIDLHLYEPRTDGSWHYGSALGGESFPDESLSGRGVVDGLVVRCESPAWAVRFHTGYPPRPVDRHDVRLLCERFALERPDGFVT